ncbi:uncharacterized protein ASCRUDRAFT_8860 [Ascoidea rubescens DSM 1968]|uniref:Uncharacterized protein n=1 Tax=Ascoidea rubescens DSM 1968 TaxID=1344418 RepID=A0A1D2VEZ3_9ASCO|nr:hypothetical protein ASCRUDRAFT_8860 [Ascoidea rubescens DSM 1968]ODV60090.1 hypothetical protein ASCRUDRAFT_8860 [Ascoidea rubescens DSM 1968]
MSLEIYNNNTHNFNNIINELKKYNEIEINEKTNLFTQIHELQSKIKFYENNINNHYHIISSPTKEKETAVEQETHTTDNEIIDRLIKDKENYKKKYNELKLDNFNKITEIKNLRIRLNNDSENDKTNSDHNNNISDINNKLKMKLRDSILNLNKLTMENEILRKKIFNYNQINNKHDLNFFNINDFNKNESKFPYNQTFKPLNELNDELSDKENANANANGAQKDLNKELDKEIKDEMIKKPLPRKKSILKKNNLNFVQIQIIGKLNMLKPCYFKIPAKEMDKNTNNIKLLRKIFIKYSSKINNNVNSLIFKNYKGKTIDLERGYDFQHGEILYAYYK